MVTECEQFVRGQLQPLLRSGYLLTGDQQSAEDLVQDTLLKAYQRWADVERAHHPAAYMRRMLVNRFIDRTRTQRLDLVPLEGQSGAWLTVADESDALVERHCIDNALKTLSPRERTVVVLKHYHHMTTTEIGSLLGLAESSVRATLSRAMKHLRGELTARNANEAKER